MLVLSDTVLQAHGADLKQQTQVEVSRASPQAMLDREPETAQCPVVDMATLGG